MDKCIVKGWRISFLLMSLLFSTSFSHISAETSADVPGYKRMEQSDAVYEELTGNHPYKLGARVTDAFLFAYANKALSEGYSYFSILKEPHLNPPYEVAYFERSEGQPAYVFNARETRKLINEKYGYEESDKLLLNKLLGKKELTLDDYTEIVNIRMSQAIKDGESWEHVIDAIKAEIDARKKAKLDPVNSAIIEFKREALTMLYICLKKDLKDPYINLETQRAKFLLSEPDTISKCGPILKRNRK